MNKLQSALFVSNTPKNEIPSFMIYAEGLSPELTSSSILATCIAKRKTPQETIQILSRYEMMKGAK